MVPGGVQAQLMGGAAMAQNDVILVVDDDANVRVSVKRTLERRGYTVVLAENGIQALERFKERTLEVKVALVDLVMPVMDGRATIAALRTLSPTLRIIAVSGLMTSAAGLSKDNPVEFLSKPYSGDALVRCLESPRA